MIGGRKPIRRARPCPINGLMIVGSFRTKARNMHEPVSKINENHFANADALNPIEGGNKFLTNIAFLQPAAEFSFNECFEEVNRRFGIIEAWQRRKVGSAGFDEAVLALHGDFFKRFEAI